MPAKKKTEAEQLLEAELEGQIVDLKLMGYSFRAIGEELSNEERKVNYETARRCFLRVMKERAKERAELVVEEHLSAELDRIDMLIREAWQGWKRSVGKMRETLKDAGFTDKGDYKKRKVKRWSQAGDPRFLQVIKDLIVERNRLLGTYDVLGGGKGSAGKQGSKLTQVVLQQNVYIPGLGHLNNDQMTQMLRDIEASIEEEDDD